MIPAPDEIFGIEALTHHEGQITANLCINAKSSIFNGHFLGQPVVPGACMLQLVKDVLEENLNTSLQLNKAGNIKFISMIIPTDSPTANMSISYKINDAGEVNVNAKLLTGEVTCFKLQGIFTKV